MTLKTYERIWKVEKKFYSIYNLTLPVPIVPIELGFFAGGLALVFVLEAIVPAFKMVPWIIRFGILPYAGTRFLRKKKFDGKNPIKFLADYILFLPQKNKGRELFHSSDKLEQKLCLNWKCSSRNMNP